MTKPIPKDEVIRRLAFNQPAPNNWQNDSSLRWWRNRKTSEIITRLEVFNYQRHYCCQTCGAITPDIRHLTLDCGYNLHEVSHEFEMWKLSLVEGGEKWVFTLRICKGCRELFMFDYLAHFISNAKRIRQEKNIDSEGITCLQGGNELLTDKEPTQEQIKEFWEWCGFERVDYFDTSNKICASHWTHPLAKGGGSSSLPVIDLNNLFKYAVPDLERVEIIWQNTPKIYCHATIRGYTGKSKEFAGKEYTKQAETPALALFWAIYGIVKSPPSEYNIPR